jgi:Domain of unknown function (DUF4389)
MTKAEDKKSKAKRPSTRTASPRKGAAKKAGLSARKAGTAKASAKSDKPAESAAQKAKAAAAAAAAADATKAAGTAREAGAGEGIWTKDAKLEKSGSVADKLWRMIAMVAFAFIGYFTFMAIVILAAMQFVVVFLDDKPNKEIHHFTGRLGSFLNETFAFLTYRQDEMPFPFSTFPEKTDKAS